MTHWIVHFWCQFTLSPGPVTNTACCIQPETSSFWYQFVTGFMPKLRTWPPYCKMPKSSNQKSAIQSTVVAHPEQDIFAWTFVCHSSSNTRWNGQSPGRNITLYTACQHLQNWKTQRLQTQYTARQYCAMNPSWSLALNRVTSLKQITRQHFPVCCLQNDLISGCHAHS